MKRRGITQYRLIKYYGISAGQINRLKKNSYVSTHTIDVLCTILNCSVEDIMEFRMNSAPTPELGIDPAVALPADNQMPEKDLRSPSIASLYDADKEEQELRNSSALRGFSQKNSLKVCFHKNFSD